MDHLDKYKRILAEKNEVYLRVKARPGASVTGVRDVMDGEEGETLKIDINGIPEKGKANAELTRYVSSEFDVSKSDVHIISGAGNKIKLIKIIKKYGGKQ